jgi:hypothetical protein
MIQETGGRGVSRRQSVRRRGLSAAGRKNSGKVVGGRAASKEKKIL